jgi:hypothetical protein
MRVALIAVLTIICCVTAHADSGAWPEPRQNSHLTAVQPLAGAMTKAPSLLARRDLGRGQPSLTPVAMDDGSHVGLALLNGVLHCIAQDGQTLWQSHPEGINYSQIVGVEDYNGDGKKTIALKAGRSTEPFGAALLVDLEDGKVLWRYDVEPMSYAWYFYAGAYLPDTESKQFVVIMHGYPPDKENGYIAVFKFAGDSKKPEQLWRYDFDDYTCFPSFLQTDLDGDGAKELAVETHSRMWFFDAATGERKQFLGWDVSPGNVRSYGLVEFVDLNGDAREDFLCIANFSQHHEVLLNKDGQMEQAWAHGWPESVTTGKVVTTWPEPPYGDLDGDGDLEVVVSMYNSEDNGNWLVRAYDAVTGKLEYRQQGMIAAALHDVDSDGQLEIIANASDDPAVGRRDGGHETKGVQGAHVLKVLHGAMQSIWHDETAVAVRMKGDDRPQVQRGATFAKLVRHLEDVLGEQAWTAPAPPPPPAFANVPAIVGGAMPELLAADLLGDARNEIIEYTASTVRVFTLEKDGSFSIQGEYTSSCLPVLADLNGDGALEVVVTDVRADARPTVTAYTPSLGNEELWRVQLPESERSGLPASRLAYLRTAHFTGQATPDLYLWAGTPMVRSVGLNGRDGSVLWEKGEVPNSERYWGASVNYASTYDFNGDGNEDLVFTNPDYYCVADGTTGDFLLGPEYPPNIFDQPSQGLYTYPALLPEESGDPTVCLVAGHYFQAAMSLQAKPLWYDLPMAGQARSSREGFARSADGSWLLGFGRQNGAFACLNAQDGTPRWELESGGTCSDTIACDVDGDGTDEFVFATSHGELIAVRDEKGEPKPLWRVSTGGGGGQPIAADVNGDGRSEIVLPTVDGYLNVFGVPAQ